jgi:hypothetical protein
MRKSNISCQTRRARAFFVFGELAMGEVYAVKPTGTTVVIVDQGR